MAGLLVRIAEQAEARVLRAQEIAASSLAYLREQTAELLGAGMTLAQALTAAAKRLAAPNGNRKRKRRPRRPSRPTPAGALDASSIDHADACVLDEPVEADDPVARQQVGVDRA